MTTDRTDAPFIIVGGGMAGDAAARGIRMVEEDHPIVLLTTEGSGPYDRPPLSKDPLASDLAERVDRQTSSEGVDVRTRARVRRIDRKGRRVVLQDGEALEWRGLVLAPGARPVVPAWARVPDGAEDLEVLAFRTLEDARALAGRVEEGCVPLVVGGGFVGTELAAALAKSGHAPALAYPEDAPLGRVLPDPFPRLMARYLEGLGVELQPGTAFRSTETLASSAREAARRRGGSRAVVVLGLGVSPRVELAREAGLQVGPEDDPGIHVDSELATADPGIRGAGDAICYPCPFLGGNRIRTEHEEHANESGVIAGAGVAGEPRSYAPIPSFHSSVGDLVWEGLGRLDLRGARTTVEAGSEPDAPGVALHRRDDRIQGVVVWNRPGRVPRIQRLLRDSAGGGDSAPGDEELERRILELVLE